MMINNWKTAEEIKKDYGLSDATWTRWRQKCEASPYKDAIIRVSERSTYVVETQWQKFLTWQSKEFKEDHLDPHLKDMKVLSN